MSNLTYSDITPQVEALSKLCIQNNNIDPALYAKYDVKRGLRDISGRFSDCNEIAEIALMTLMGIN